VIFLRWVFLVAGADVNAAYGAGRTAVTNNFAPCAALLFTPQIAATWCVLAALTYKIALEYQKNCLIGHHQIALT
jgi:hypothetical protein